MALPPLSWREPALSTVEGKGDGGMVEAVVSADPSLAAWRFEATGLRGRSAAARSGSWQKASPRPMMGLRQLAAERG